jgi:hypothetical protein
MTFCLQALLMKPYNTLCKLIATLQKTLTMLVRVVWVKCSLLKLMARQCDL